MIDKLPILNNPIAGQSHIIFELTSGSNFSDAVQLQENEGITDVAAFFKSLNLNLDVVGDEETLEGVVKIIGGILGDKVGNNYKDIVTLIESVNMDFKFSSWESLPEETRQKLKGKHM